MRLGGLAPFTRAFKLLLRLYPRAFREAFGQEMAAVFAERLAAASQCGGLALLSFGARELGGLIGQGIREQVFALWARPARVAQTSAGPEWVSTVGRWRPRLSVFEAVLAVLLVAGTAWLLTLGRPGPFHSTTAVADLNGDGRLDVLVTHVRQESEFTAFSVTVAWINEGQGRFTTASSPESNWGGWGSGAGDFDGDGDNDLAVFDGGLRLLLNQGGAPGGQTGTFRYTRAIRGPARGGQFGSIVLGDLNNDGRVDIFVAGCCGQAFPEYPDEAHLPPSLSWVWLNRQEVSGWLDGPAVNVPELAGLAVRAAALGDLDGDGSLDVFAAVGAPAPRGDGGTAERVLLNDGQGIFRDSGQRLGADDSLAVALGDLDSDGDLDAVVGTARGTAVWINQGGVQSGAAGTFAADRQRLPSGRTTRVSLADLDGDGNLDALIGAERQAVIWWNDGRGAFERSDQRLQLSARDAVTVGDFNGDGHPDLFASVYDELHMVWLNLGDGHLQRRLP